MGTPLQVLITGGAGFIGSHLVDRLVAEGHRVRVLDDLSTGSADNLPSEAELLCGSVVDPAAVRTAVAGAHWVFHHAAARAVLQSVERPLQTDLVNTHGTLTVLDCARTAGVARVVFASSSSIYGGADRLPTTEDAPSRPRSPYAVSKLAGESYCRVFTEVYGLATVSLRYFNVYGPRQRPDSAYAAVIPLFCDVARRGHAPTVHGDGLQSRDFTFVSDVVDANIAAASAPAERCGGKVYNVSYGEGHSLLRLIELLGQATGNDLRPVTAEPRPGDVRHSRADTSAAQRDLAYQPKVPLAEGLRRMLEWLSGR
ncbi:MAG: NAD-dependent epimerase/dehydratase family protein [Anaerolineales bacterium]